MHDARAELAAFYETEALEERRGEATGRRVGWRDSFVETIASADALRIVDLGAGPGTDAIGLAASGAECIGVDLAVANGFLARRRGALVVPASMFELPFASAVFDAGWSMSTLMHVPDDDIAAVALEVRRVLRPDALLAIGTWGGSLGDVVSDDRLGRRRRFHLRNAEESRRRIEAFGNLESFESWDAGPEGWEYHVARVRRPS